MKISARKMEMETWNKIRQKLDEASLTGAQTQNQKQT